MLDNEVGSVVEANAGAATGLLQGQCQAVVPDEPFPVVVLAQPAADKAAVAAIELSQRVILRTRHLLAATTQLSFLALCRLSI
ncbi:MAG TPA: hypothetical protein VG056_12190 [Pirellulales bacterium]|nr:hypothetical protein [Pirellulales bacterium]